MTNTCGTCRFWKPGEKVQIGSLTAQRKQDPWYGVACGKRNWKYGGQAGELVCGRQKEAIGSGVISTPSCTIGGTTTGTMPTLWEAAQC